MSLRFSSVAVGLSLKRHPIWAPIVALATPDSLSYPFSGPSDSNFISSSGGGS